MCPRCSKYGCCNCMNRWVQSKQECPHCRSPLRVSDLVNCRFLTDLSAELLRLDAFHGNNSSNSNINSEMLFPSSVQHLRANGSVVGSPLSGSAAPAALHGGCPPGHCPEHPNMSLQYYCKTCDSAVCSDCAMFSPTHKNHEFQHLVQIYDEHLRMISDKKDLLQGDLGRVRTVITSLDSYLGLLQEAKDTRLNEIAEAIASMRSRLQADYQSRMRLVIDARNCLENEVSIIETAVCEVDRRISKAPMNVMVAQSADLLKQLNALHEQQLEVQLRDTSMSASSSSTLSPPGGSPGRVDMHLLKNLSTIFENELVPEYETGVFRLVGYSQMINAMHFPAPGGLAPSAALPPVYYSDSIVSNGISWRLKVYPVGNGPARGTHVSIFLEMLSGPAHGTVGKYQYRLELVHPTVPQNSFVREFASDFEVTEAWGFNRFVRLTNIARDGFLCQLDGGSLLLRFGVRPMSYLQAWRDQKRYSEQLESLNTEKTLAIARLEGGAAAAAGEQRQQMMAGPAAGGSCESGVPATLAPEAESSVGVDSQTAEGSRADSSQSTPDQRQQQPQQQAGQDCQQWHFVDESSSEEATGQAQRTGRLLSDPPDRAAAVDKRPRVHPLASQIEYRERDGDDDSIENSDDDALDVVEHSEDLAEEDEDEDEEEEEDLDSDEDSFEQTEEEE